MPRSNAAAFPRRHQRLAAYYQALAHPARTMILDRLLEREWDTFRSLTDALPLSQASRSRHVGFLVRHRILVPAVEHKVQGYRIHPDYYDAMRRASRELCRAA